MKSFLEKVLVAIVILLFVISSILVYANSQPTATGLLNLNYTVTIQNDRPSIHIKLEIMNITTTELTLKFKDEAWYAENYAHSLSASSDGRNLTVTHSGQGTWTIRQLGSSVTFEYDIDKVVPFGYFTPDYTTISVYFNNQGGVIMAPFFFIYPAVTDVNSVTIKFDVPAGWQVVTPYLIEGDHFTVQKVTNSLLFDFVNRQQIYMGKMKFYAEQQLDNCTLKLGVLEADEGMDALENFGTQAQVENALNVTASVYKTLVNLFGENPYKVFTVYSSFRPLLSGPNFPGVRYFGNGYTYWAEHRWNELAGHMVYTFMITDGSAPLLAQDEVAKGMGEMYYGPKLAWSMFNDPIYLGDLYYYYLIYDRFFQSDKTSSSEYSVYAKAPFVALMLDSEIQNLTSGAKSLNDVLKYVYSTYKNTGYNVDWHYIQNAVRTVTGNDFQDLFSRYVYGSEKIPYSYIQSYKPYFLEYPQRFAQAYSFENFPDFNKTIPLFINIEMIVHQDGHIPLEAVIYAGDNVRNFASYVLSHYTIASLTEKNVEDALSAVTGANCSGFFTRWTNSFGRLSLAEVKDWLQSYGSVAITVTSNLLSSGCVTVDGVAMTAPAVFTWAIGSAHTLQALTPVAGPVGTQYVWIGWSDGGPQTRTYTAPTSSATITANYKTQYYLTNSAINGNLVPSSGWYDAGTRMNLANSFSPTTAAGERYVWSGWTGTGNGSYTGTSNPAINVVTMNGPITEISGWAHQYEVLFTVNPTGGGTTTPSGSNVWCDAGSAISLVASPNTGYTFSSWSTTGPAVFASPSSVSTNATVNGPGTITATFTQIVIPELAPVAQLICLVTASAAILLSRKKQHHPKEY